jgi:hypothetical protein
MEIVLTSQSDPDQKISCYFPFKGSSARFSFSIFFGQSTPTWVPDSLSKIIYEFDLELAEIF